ncbi:unnamed protein product [Debaryomyces fabryi]|nr:unnamed protein product [Debaryomyces fabryi]
MNCIMLRCYRYISLGVQAHRATSFRRYSNVSAKINTKVPEIYSINDMKDENEINASIFERLSKVYQILSGRTRRFRYAANECRDLYIQSKASLLDDLLQYPRINKDMITFLFVNYSFSNSIKALLLDDLNRLLLAGNFEIIIKSFEKMLECGIVSASVEDNFMHITTHSGQITKIELRNALAQLLVNQALNSGEHLLASSFALEFKASSIPLNNETIRLLLRSLAIDTTTNYIYNSYTIIKILNEFPTSHITLSDMCDLLLYLAEGKQQPFFANILYDKILQSSLLDKQLDEDLKTFLEAAIKMIQKNIEHGEITRAEKIWNSIKAIKVLSTEHTTVLSMLIEKLIEVDEEAAGRLVSENLSIDLGSNPDLQDCILRFVGTHTKHTGTFENLVKQLKPPLRRLTLSLLFEAFLLQNNESGAEKILLFIFKSENGINFLDFDSIIKKLIKQQKITECINMLKSTDIEISKLGYISIFKYLIRTSSKDKEAFLEDLSIRYQKLGNGDKCFSLLTAAFFDYVSENINNRVSRSLFTHLSRNSHEGISLFHDNRNELNLEQYSFPKGFLHLLSLDGSARLECLWIISNQAIKDYDLNTLRWCIEELRFSGVLLEDILSVIFTRDPEFYRDVLQEENLPFSFQH